MSLAALDGRLFAAPGVQPHWLRPAAVAAVVALHAAALIILPYLSPAPAPPPPPAIVVDVEPAPAPPAAEPQREPPSALPTAAELPPQASPSQVETPPRPVETLPAQAAEAHPPPVEAPPEPVVPPPWSEPGAPSAAVEVPPPAAAPAPPGEQPPPPPAPVELAPPKPPPAVRVTPPRPVESRPTLKPPRVRDRLPQRETRLEQGAKADERAQEKPRSGSPRADSASQAAYVSAVASAIRSRLFYPPAARARGARGVVGVAFTIGASGGVSSFAITRPSGDADLDRSARALVQSARFPPPPGGSAHVSTSFNYVPP